MIENKQQRLLTWLKSDEMKDARTDFERGSGFVMTSKVKVQCKDHSVKSVVDVLKDAGFEDKMKIDGYDVRYGPANAKYPNDAFRFFLENLPIAAPDFL